MPNKDQHCAKRGQGRTDLCEDGYSPLAGASGMAITLNSSVHHDEDKHTRIGDSSLYAQNDESQRLSWRGCTAGDSSLNARNDDNKDKKLISILNNDANETEIEKGKLIDIVNQSTSNGFKPNGADDAYRSYSDDKDTKLISILQTNESENNPDVEIYKKNGSPVTTEDYSIGNDNTTAEIEKECLIKNVDHLSSALPSDKASLSGDKSNTDILNTQEVTRK